MINALIVEDSEAFRLTLKSILKDHCPLMNLAEAASGEEAWARLQAFVPDIIFMDIRLPGINGLDLTRKIRAVHAGPKIIVLTSYDLPEYREAALASGADQFLCKDAITVEEIASLVETARSSRDRGPQGPPA
jgi:DNA-binding NarL/FixJ family response regulator